MCCSCEAPLTKSLGILGGRRGRRQGGGGKEWCGLAREALPGVAEDSLRQRTLGRAGTGSPVRQGGPPAGPLPGCCLERAGCSPRFFPRDPEEQPGLGGAGGLPGQTLCVQSLCVALGASLVAQTVKNLPAVQETWVQSLGQEEPLEKGMATHSSILAWKIPWTEEPGRLQSIGFQRVGHD